MNELVKVDKGSVEENVDEIVAETFRHFKDLIVRYPGKANSFNNIWKALELIRKANGKNYTIASVGKITKDFGGPLAQTIRNPGSEEFRALITMYAKAVEKPEEPDAKDPHSSLLKEVSDLHTKQHIRLLLQENTSLRNQLNTLKKNFSENAPKIDATRHAAPVASGAGPILTESKIQAIKAFLSGLGKKGYTLNEFGAIIDPDGLELAGPGFVDALEDILKQGAKMLS